MEKIIELIKKYKNIIVLSIFIILLIIEAGIFFYFYTNKKQEKEIISCPNEEKEKSTYYVNIKGEVNSPGVYEVENDMTVNDAIYLAGGLTENADTLPTNLSKKLEDEMVIIIFSKEEVQSFKTVKQDLLQVQEKCNCDEYIDNNSCINIESLEDSDKININTATKEELMSLSGIGESKAISIIKYREEHGNFKDINEIKNISGIGDSLFDKIKENITV